MSLDLGELLVRIRADQSELDAGINQAKAKTENASKVMNASWAQTAASMTRSGMLMSAAVTLPLAGAGVAAVKLASDLSETMNKIDVIFKDDASEIKRWSKTSITQMGLAQQSALDMVALFGDMGTSMGFVASEAADMGIQLTERAADLASFKNIQIEVAKTALNGVFSGETESLKQLGVVMTVANLEAFALSKGMKTLYADMTQNQQVSLRFAYVMEKTSNAAGDFARTSDGVANQTRMASEQIKQLGASMGNILLPVAAKLLKTINDLLTSFTDLPEAQKKTIITLMGVAAAIGPVLMVVGKLNTGVLGLVTSFSNVAKAVGSGTGLVTALGAMVGPAGVVILATAAIAGLAAVLYTAHQRATEATDKVRDLVAAYDESVQTFKDQKAVIEYNSQLTKDLADELYKLAAKTNKTAEEQARMVVLVKQLNTLMPELSLTIDAQTGALNMQRGALDNAVESMKKRLLMAADEERLAAVFKKTAEDTKNLAEQQERLTKATQAYKDFKKQSVGFDNPFITKELTEATDAVRLLTDTIAAEKAEADALANSWGRAAGAISQSSEMISDTTTKAAVLTKQQLEDLAEAEKRHRKIVEDESNAITDAYWKAQDEQIKNQLEFNKAFETNMQNHMDQMGSIEDAGIEKSKITANQVKANLEKQIKDFQGWQTGVQKLAKRVPEDVMAELYALGPKFAPLIADLNKKSDARLNSFVETWRKKGALAESATLAELGSLPAAMTTIGSNAGQGFANGMLSKLEVLKAAAAAMGKVVPYNVRRVLEMESPSKVLKKLGIFVPEGLALGIMGGIKKVEKASDAMADAAIPTLSVPTIAATTMAAPAADYSRYAAPSIKPGAVVGAPGASVLAGGSADMTETNSLLRQLLDGLRPDRAVALNIEGNRAGELLLPGIIHANLRQGSPLKQGVR